MRFEPNGIYHVYNRGNRSIPIFYEERNYGFFIQKIKTHVSPHASVLAYCLMPTHFHLMLKVNDKINEGVLNREIAIMLRSYTRAINIQEKTSGSLFQSKTKAKELGGKAGLPLICFNYIHLNPLNANLVGNLRDWGHSSFAAYACGIEDDILNKGALIEILDIDLSNYEKSIFDYLIDGKLKKELSMQIW